MEALPARGESDGPIDLRKACCCALRSPRTPI